MIHQLDKTNLLLCPEPLPFMEGRRSEIDRYWHHVKKKNARLWNGYFYMFSEVQIEDQTMHAKGHKTDFATFLYWRDHGRDAGITHITGTTFMHFSDGCLLAVKMADHTANPGRIYFPAGSFDKDDLVDDLFDARINIYREFREEIGLDIQEDWVFGPLLASEGENAYHIALPARLPFEFEQVERQWEIHRANGGDDEIHSLVRICHRDDIPLEMPTYATALCHYHFDRLER